MADERLVNQARERVEQMCGPKLMSKNDAIDFLEDVIEALKSSIEALQDELRNEKEAE